MKMMVSGLRTIATSGTAAKRSAGIFAIGIPALGGFLEASYHLQTTVNTLLRVVVECYLDVKGQLQLH